MMDDANAGVAVVNKLLAIEAHLQQEFKQLQKRESVLEERCDRLYGLEHKLYSFIDSEVSKKTEEKDNKINELEKKLRTKDTEICRLNSSFSTLCTAHEKLKKQSTSLQAHNDELKSKVYALSMRLKSMHQQKRPKEQKKEVGVNTDHTIHREKKLSVDQQQFSSAKDSLLCHLLPIVSVQNLSSVNILEFCRKTLPVITNVLASVSEELLLPFLQFTHWLLLHSKGLSLTHLIRRIGTHLCKEVSPVLNIPLLSNDSTEVRMLVALLVLETVSQVDAVLFVLSCLKEELHLNKQCHQLFLSHQGLDVVQPFLNSSSPLVCSMTVELHLELSLDGGQAFLDACSSEAWFTRVTTLLSGSDKLSQNTLEKLSIILQRLSKNSASCNLFWQSRMVKSLQKLLSNCDKRKCSFLVLNISSILTNIGTT